MRDFSAGFDLEKMKALHDDKFKVTGQFEVTLKGIQTEAGALKVIREMFSQSLVAAITATGESQRAMLKQNDDGDYSIKGCICCWDDVYGWCPCSSYTGCTVSGSGCPA